VSAPEPQEAETVVLVPVPARAALEAKLRDLKEQFDALESVEPHHRRMAAYQSLVAVIGFIDSFPEWRGANLDFALAQMMAALTDLDSGKPVDWLRPVNDGNRPPVAIHIRGYRGRCAATMELLMRGGRQQKAAGQFIARRLPAAFRKEIGLSGWQTVAKWREKIETGSPEAEGYDAVMCLTDTPAWKATTLDTAARQALQSMVKFHLNAGL
jgi:hypothetical protein